MSTSLHLAHGLAGDYTLPDWPALTHDEVTAVVSHYPPLEGKVTLVWHSPRPLSAAALVDTPQGRVFIKRHHQHVRTPTTLAEEHRFMGHLRSKGLPVVPVLVTQQGDTVLARGDFVYEVHAMASGHDLYRDTLSWAPPYQLAHARAAGQSLAQMHLAARDYDAPQRETSVLVARSELIRAPDLLLAMREQLAHRPALADYLRERDWESDFRTHVLPWQQSVASEFAALPACWTHGDWHVSNLYWSNTEASAKVSAVLDFGLSARNFALFDLVTAIERNAIAWLNLESNGGQPAMARALMAGYHEVLPLHADERRLLAALLPIVHLDFALSEVEYYHGITYSPDNARAAYEDFLLAHAHWFTTLAGQDFLRALQGKESLHRG